MVQGCDAPPEEKVPDDEKIRIARRTGTASQERVHSQEDGGEGAASSSSRRRRRSKRSRRSRRRSRKRRSRPHWRLAVRDEVFNDDSEEGETEIRKRRR
jgi:hypothetical protein